MQIEIQIVDTHETLETPVVIGSQAFDYQINRTLLGGNIDLLTLARNARTSVEMIEKFYASTLSAEMNISLLHSKRRA